jgi:hypothetical protein
MCLHAQFEERWIEWLGDLCREIFTSCSKFGLGNSLFLIIPHSFPVIFERGEKG